MSAAGKKRKSEEGEIQEKPDKKTKFYPTLMQYLEGWSCPKCGTFIDVDEDINEAIIAEQIADFLNARHTEDDSDEIPIPVTADCKICHAKLHLKVAYFEIQQNYGEPAKDIVKAEEIEEIEFNEQCSFEF